MKLLLRRTFVLKNSYGPLAAGCEYLLLLITNQQLVSTKTLLFFFSAVKKVQLFSER
jgi:hypothetical protein